MIVNISRDFEQGFTVVSLDGELNWADVSAVRSLLLKALADCPVAVIVDLTGISQYNDVALSVFATAQRHARQEPVVEFMLCAPRRELARRLRQSFRYVPVYATVEEAVTKAISHPAAEYWAHVHLAPRAEAASLARTLVGDACLDWGVPDLLRPARWVVSELAQNAFEHANTEIDVTATLRGRFLHLSVHDRSPEPIRLLKKPEFDPRAPMEERGQGLRIVSRYSTHWGCILTPAGKNVWAILRTGVLS